jgi:hypothetical protein
MNPEVRLLIDFLNDKQVLGVKQTNGTLEEFIEINFNVLTESVLRLLITQAMIDRDNNVAKGHKDKHILGHWGLIIDTIKGVI